ncbi:MAG: site-specific integrase [Anaerolineales bacterium]|nr:site-specific integrase [Anaerolineales bacterium]
MTATEFTAIVEQINLDKVIDNRDYALLMTVWYTGCPASQVLKLRWGDIKKNFNDNYVFAYQDRAGEWNDIELPLQTYQAIRRYLQVANRLETIRQEDYIFTASDRTRIFRIPSKKTLSK